MTSPIRDAGQVPSRKKLFSRLENDLDRFYSDLRERLRSDVFLIDQGVRYLVKVRGKALRPFVVLASARLFGEPNDLTYRAAMIVELLHTATLIHDDVVDKAETRRSWPTFNRIWGNKYSVLFGDYLLAHSLIATLEKGNLEMVRLLAETARRMSQGQLKELARARRKEVNLDGYFSMITDKTASLFRACAELGALTLERSDAERSALADYGLHLGIAFQVRDDILDFNGHRKLLGKPARADLADHHYTLPLLCALAECDESVQRRILQPLKRTDGSRKSLEPIYRFVREQGGVEKAEAVAESHAERAVSAIEHIGSHDKRILLTELAVFTARRNA